MGTQLIPPGGGGIILQGSTLEGLYTLMIMAYWYTMQVEIALMVVVTHVLRVHVTKPPVNADVGAL